MVELLFIASEYLVVAHVLPGLHAAGENGGATGGHPEQADRRCTSPTDTNDYRDPGRARFFPTSGPSGTAKSETVEAEEVNTVL
ncbi:hypothetical protein [Embleya sp. NPDC059237]|uniref:hypothetical protein n=1 Tax=Embleya sp. NPDC059237 TaxID=3346784 RepID=UPI0036D018CC